MHLGSLSSLVAKITMMRWLLPDFCLSFPIHQRRTICEILKILLDVAIGEPFVYRQFGL